ncbi:thiamine pyrophosphate-binding protein [Nocardioides daejeonensis]|uniref:thiamine pyrophosphate-binding protein n=1 Tax=Nocardioides daejeonensis TaxID=1046556 RepID=UPI000D741612|nr:thiamine pyrophosphate-binding protein [Nocardioides daejeonensis]
MSGAASTSMTGGEALVRALADHGVDTVFGIPGTHNLSAYAALARHGITHVSPRHEQGAGYAADGYARSSGRVGVALTTTGPAILNAAAAAAQAYSDSVPVLFISPGMPLQHPGMGNGLLHEIKNQPGSMEAVLGVSIRVTSVAEIPLAVAQAFATMLEGRPRPVHLEIPLDLLDVVAEVAGVPPVLFGTLQPAPAAVEAAVSLLDGAERVVMVTGGGAFHAADQARRLAERLDAAVLSTANGKGTVPEDHPLFVGTGLQHAAARELCGGADVVLAVGTEFAPSDWWGGLPDFSGRVIRIDIDGAEINANVVPDVAVVGDAAATLDQLLERTRVHDPAEWTAPWRARLLEQAAVEGAPWLEMVQALTEVLPRDTIVAADNAMAVYYGALSNLPLHRPHAFLYPTGAGTLGFGLPAGIGAKVAQPEAPVLVLQGDGGIMFTIAELAMAAEARLALPVVIVDNGGYGEIRNEMEDRGEPIHAVGLGHPDFVQLGRSLGCHGIHVEDALGLAAAVKEAFDADRPTVIHIREHSRASGDGVDSSRASGDGVDSSRASGDGVDSSRASGDGA